MVSRSHHAFYFSQTCSLNMSGEIFDTMRSWQRVQFRDKRIKTFKKKYPLFFQMGGVADFVSVQNFVTPGNLSSKYSTCFAQNAVSAGSAHLFDHKP